MADLDTQMFVGQKAFIERDGTILVLGDPNYRVHGQVGLDFPGGRYRWGGDLLEELNREIIEETGLQVRIGKPFITWTNHNHGTKSPKRIYLVGYLCQYVSGEVRLSDEHDKFEWVDNETYKNWREKGSYFEALEYYFEHDLK